MDNNWDKYRTTATKKLSSYLDKAPLFVKSQPLANKPVKLNKGAKITK